MTLGVPYVAVSKGRKSENYRSQVDGVRTINNGKYFTDILSVPADERGTVGRIHPAQKPIALFEYLIRTYSSENEVILDNTMGSGTTGVAALNTKRRFIGIEKDPAYFSVAVDRIMDAAEKAGTP